MTDKTLRDWENEAAAFLQATGFLRPGKDVPAAMNPSDEYMAHRELAWKSWCAGHDHAALADSAEEAAHGKHEAFPNLDSADAQGPYQMDAVDDIPPELKEKIGRAVAEEITRQAGAVDYFKIWRAGLMPCRERLNNDRRI